MVEITHRLFSILRMSIFIVDDDCPGYNLCQHFLVCIVTSQISYTYLQVYNVLYVAAERQTQFW